LEFGLNAGMARKLRVLFEGAIYHVMFRGNVRERIFLGDKGTGLLAARLGSAVPTFRDRFYESW